MDTVMNRVADTTCLELLGVSSGYGRMTILSSIDITIGTGETVALLGRNGSGKTTLVRTIMGMVRPSAGRIRFHGAEIHRFKTERVANLGIGLVPQDRGLFPEMTVVENLRLSCFSLGITRRELQGRLDEAFERFPALAAKKDVVAASLSGGQQQMLAISKALVRRPSLLLLDEPTTGLSPIVIRDLAEVVEALHHAKLTLLVTEQNVHWLLPIADRIHILEQGQVVRSLDGVSRDPTSADVVARYIGDL